MNKVPDPIDVHVGLRVRVRRTLLGLSQSKLGDALGLTFQQIQKYERGANRIGSGRLYRISRILDVPVSFFFEELPNDVSTGVRRAAGDTQESSEQNSLIRRETLELVRAYNRIKEPKVRRRIFELAKVVGGRES